MDEVARMCRDKIDAAWTGIAACKDCGVRDLVLFADLTEADFSLIHLPIDELSLPAGALLYQAGDAGRAVFTIRRGLVKLVQFLPDGTQRVVRLLRPGSVAGLEILLGSAYEHSAVALQPVELCRIPREIIDRLNQETPRLHTQLMRRWHESLRQADEWLTEMSTGSARQRLARLMIHLADAGDGQRCTLFSREDIGAMLGITTETASRTVSDLKRNRAIHELGQNRFEIDRTLLDSLSEGC